MTVEILRDLARAKVAFQLRAIEAIIRGPTQETKGSRAMSEMCAQISDAQGIEAGTAETEGLGPKDESPVAKRCAKGPTQ